jgi:putative ABC transport system substrate-binding protein
MHFHQLKRREFITLLGGPAVAWPLAARAQQRTMPVIGFLGFGSPRSNTSLVNRFRQGLAEVGYIEGRNVAIEFRWGAAQLAQMQSLAADLVQHRLAVIVAVGALAPALAAKAATATIPIVFLYGGDPVKDGFVASLNKPGSNVTGMTSITTELASKRLELVHEMVPSVTTVAFLTGDARFFDYEERTSTMLAAGRALGLQIIVVECRSDRDFGAAFTTLVQRQAGALILGNTPFGNLDRVVALAAEHKIPAIYFNSSLVFAGGLMSYSTDSTALWRQVCVNYVGPILKGAKPADLPVQRPDKFQLVINLKTAKALGIAVPDTLLARADEVIE